MSNFLRSFALLVLLLVWHVLPAQAQTDSLEICFNYGCHQRAPATFSVQDVDQLRELLAAATDAPAERAVVGLAIGRMYAMAAAQTPIWRDRGRNGIEERHLDGAMDCIDHSTNTQAFLRLLAGKGLLRFHQPGEREIRFALLVFGEHWSATLAETATGQRFAVDSWFLDPGFPAAVVTLEKWKAGYDPDQTIEASR